jgi:uncharacterized RDD family membrane protein YckC
MSSDDVLTIETPEQTPLEYELAGVGSRVLAMLFDTLYQLAVSVMLMLALLMLAALLSSGDLFTGQSVGVRFGLMLGVTMLALFVVQFGYFLLFELRGGQTPGKRRLGLRVIHASGRPMVAHEAVARNLLRLIDGLPAAYGVGLLSIMFTSRRQRLGDLLAGTVVVHERTYDEAPFGWGLERAASAPAGGGGGEVLTTDELRVVEAFLQRRDSLEPAVRDALAHGLVTRLGERIRVTSLEREKPESTLEELARRTRERGAHG